MPKFDEFKKGQPLSAEWVNKVSRYLTNLQITGDGGICVSKRDNGFAITNQMAPEMRKLYTYELDNEGYPYVDTVTQEYRCIDKHPLVNAPPTDPDDKKWVFVKMLKGAIARNQQLIAYKIDGEWVAINIPAQISGLLQEDNGEWFIGQQKVTVPYDPSIGDSADWVVDGIIVKADWQADSAEWGTGYKITPPPIITGTLSGNLAAYGTANIDTAHWYSGGSGLAVGTGDFTCPVHNIYSKQIDSGTRVTAALDHTGFHYIVISTDCEN